MQTPLETLESGSYIVVERSVKVSGEESIKKYILPADRQTLLAGRAWLPCRDDEDCLEVDICILSMPIL